MKYSTKIYYLMLNFFLENNNSPFGDGRVHNKPAKRIKRTGYNPHQGHKEKARRVRQMSLGRLVGLFEPKYLTKDKQ